MVIWAGAAAAGVALIYQLVLSGRRDSQRRISDAASGKLIVAALSMFFLSQCKV